MKKWEIEARAVIMSAVMSPDPEATPVYRVPNRRWFFQIWKPRWRMERGVSRAQLARSHGLSPAAAELPSNRPLAGLMNFIMGDL
jgi:hypothetical protein